MNANRKVFEVFSSVIRFAQLSLDGLELFAQVVLALILGELGVDLVLHLAGEFQNANLLAQHFQQQAHPLV